MLIREFDVAEKNTATHAFVVSLDADIHARLRKDGTVAWLNKDA